MLDFNGKVILITGSAGGICSATSKLFILQGGKVINCDYQYPENQDILSEIKDNNPANIHLDIRNKNEVISVIQRVDEVLGKIDVVVNGAGILRAKPFIDVTEDEWDNLMNINLKGMFFVSQEALKVMMKKKKGCFVNISSVGGKMGGSLSSPDYAASKAGVICLTKSLAKAGGEYGIRANSIAPGAIETTMIDLYRDIWGKEKTDKECAKSSVLGRIGKPLEIANSIIFLSSDEASYITGACLDVNGGSLMD